MEIAEYIIAAGAVGSSIASLYLGVGHILKNLQKILLIPVYERLAIHERSIDYHKETLFGESRGLQGKVSDLRQRVAKIEGFQSGAHND